MYDYPPSVLLNTDRMASLFDSSYQSKHHLYYSNLRVYSTGVGPSVHNVCVEDVANYLSLHVIPAYAANPCIFMCLSKSHLASNNTPGYVFQTPAILCVKRPASHICFKLFPSKGIFTLRKRFWLSSLSLPHVIL